MRPDPCLSLPILAAPHAFPAQRAAFSVSFMNGPLDRLAAVWQTYGKRMAHVWQHNKPQPLRETVKWQVS